MVAPHMMFLPVSVMTRMTNVKSDLLNTSKPVDSPECEAYAVRRSHSDARSMEAVGLGCVCIQLPVRDRFCPVMLGELSTV